MLQPPVGIGSKDRQYTAGAVRHKQIDEARFNLIFDKPLSMIGSDGRCFPTLPAD
jgi:hypothetical protein